MNRDDKRLSEDVRIARGYDDIVGTFLTVYDRRYAKTGDDIQGEGIVFDYCTLFGIETNLINVTPDDFDNDEKLLELATSVDWEGS